MGRRRDGARVTRRVVVACPDLMFKARIFAAAEGAGVTVTVVKPADLPASAVSGSLAFVDLEVPGMVEHARGAVAAGARVVGFGSHKDAALLAAARAAGVEAMPRSAFVERLSKILEEA